MSILNRPGWANRSVLTEGRLHSDDLKQRISNLFVRTSLGNSPTYAVGKIADILRREKGDDVDINDVADEDIIRVASDDEVTNGKFKPELKNSISDARQESEDSMSGVGEGLPTDQDHEEHETEHQEHEEHESEHEEDMGSLEGDMDEEDCEDCESQRPVAEPHINDILKKENTKLSPKAVDRLLKENYHKSRQHRFMMEERYRRY
jgi:hypothetical protein